MSSEIRMTVPYDIAALFVVGLTNSNQIAVAWNEGSALFDYIKNMPPVQLQNVRDRIITQIVESMDKRIPARLIIGPS